jgi:hypothetical protein
VALHRLVDIVNHDLDVHSRLDRDGGDLLDDVAGGVEVNDALVDAHLEAVPGVGTVTARGLAGGDDELLGRHADGALDLELLVLGALDEVTADLLEVLDITGGERDTDALDGSLGVTLETLLVVSGHGCAN